MVQASHDELADEISLIKEQNSELEMQKIKIQATLER
jgi:hypothetical protein